ncbi:MAG: hypothetical protein FJX56_13635, partial [Alphaproteobacteria bacterium]|nr:hypothetical protein [Alphaproteobacteria bacterium]
PALAWAAAAAIAALVVGATGGYFGASHRIELRLAALEQGQAADRAALAAAMSLALEEKVSGTSIEWTAPGSGGRGRVTPVRTFKSAGGQWCREYATVLDREGQAVRESGIACRHERGVWRTRLEIAREG